MASNQLVANPTKTKVMIVGGGGAESVQVDGDRIPSSNSEIVLGMKISSDLSWAEHVEDVHKTLTQRLHLLKRMSYKIPRTSVRMIADGIFQSKIRYGACMYIRPIIGHEESTPGNIRQLQIIQNEMWSDRVRNTDLREIIGRHPNP